MRVFVLILCFFSFHIVIAQSQLNKKLDFEAKNISIEDSLIKLSEESQTTISFSNKLIPERRKINVSLQNNTLKQILREVLKGTDLSFKIVASQVVLYKRNLNNTESISISGLIEDAETGERLIGASVFDPNNSTGTSSNDFGFYSINILKGKSILSVSYTGYETQNITIEANESTTQNIKLKTSLLLPQVVVEVNDSLSEFGVSRRISVESLETDKLAKIPNIGGEPDILRSVYSNSGVGTGADGVGGLHVRGGGVDQNLMLMDGVPIYNPFHGLGVLSIFNTNAVRKATFYKGAFPAKFSGRLSSILDVQTKEGNLQKYSGAFNIGLISAKATFEGPIVKNKASFFISGRRSLTDFYIPQISEMVKEANDKMGASNYLFWDMNAKINIKLSKNDRIYISAYKGVDEFSDSNDIATVYDTVFLGGNFIIPYTIDDEETSDLNWSNEVLSLRWNRILGEKMFVNTNAYLTKYKFSSSEFSDSRAFYELEEPLNDYILDRNQFKSEIVDIGIRSDFEYLPNNQTRLQFGVVAINHTYQPQSILQEVEASMVPGAIDLIELKDTTNLDEIMANEIQTYFEGAHMINEKVKLTLGINNTFWMLDDYFDFSIQPRIIMDFKLSKAWFAQISASKMNQYQHLLTNSDIGLPSDIWLPSTEKVPGEFSYQSQAQLRYKSPKIGSVTLGGYYKRLNNLIEYLDENAEIILNAENWEDKISIGTGESWGLEFAYEKTFKGASFIINYTYSETDRIFDELNEGKPFPYRFDLTHNLFANFTYKFNNKLDMGLSWSYQSGINITFPRRKLVISSDFVIGSDMIDLPPFVLGIPNSKNGLRVRPNHKLDLSLNYNISPKSTFQQTLHLGIYNIYNRTNPIYYKLRRDPNDLERSQLVQVALFKIIPNFSYSIKF